MLNEFLQFVGANWVTLAAIVVLIMLSGFFSGSETALTAVSRARMHSLENNGEAKAGMVNKLIERRDRLIGTLLIGNNLVNILASSLATSLLLNAFGESGVVKVSRGVFSYSRSHLVGSITTPPLEKQLFPQPRSKLKSSATIRLYQYSST